MRCLDVVQIMCITKDGLRESMASHCQVPYFQGKIADGGINHMAQRDVIGGLHITEVYIAE